MRSAVGQARNMVGGTERRKVKETARPRPYRRRIVGKRKRSSTTEPGQTAPGPLRSRPRGYPVPLEYPGPFGREAGMLPGQRWRYPGSALTIG